MDFKKILFLFLLLPFLFLSAVEIQVGNGDKMVFLGDSITNFGRRSGGFVALLEHAFRKLDLKVVLVNKGINGQMSTHMAARVDRDVITQQAQWLILCCGVNDVNMGSHGVSLEDYKKNITVILDKALAAEMRIVLVTPTVISMENINSNGNRTLELYCAFLRGEAEKRGLLLADANRDMREALQKMSHVKGLKVTEDGLHMNGYGNQIIAVAILKAMGAPERFLAECRLEWNKIPSMQPFANQTPDNKVLISIDDYELLRREADMQNILVDDLVKQLISSYIGNLKNETCPIVVHVADALRGRSGEFLAAGRNSAELHRPGVGHHPHVLESE